MTTIRAKLSASHLSAAREMIENGTGDGTIYADDKTDGLVLRVRKTAATFSLKYAGMTRLLGPLSQRAKGDVKPGEIQTIQAARDLAEKVRALLKDGTDPTAFLSGKTAGKSEEKAEAAAVRATAIQSGMWTWEKLVEEYADGYLSKPRKVKDRIRQPSPRSAAQAKRSLTPPEADDLRGLLLTELDPRHIEGVRDDCMKREGGGKTPSRSFVMYAKAALSFAKRRYKAKSGLFDVKPWWLGVEILDDTAVESRTRMPSLNDLAKVLYAAEKRRVLDGRKNARATSETVLCGLWWIALTAQRTGAALALEKAHIMPWPESSFESGNGWMVVSWSETAMKSKRFHALPIPPRLVLLLERAMATGRQESRFVFPATATREGKTDGHLDKNAPKNLISRLRGSPLTLRRKEEEIRSDLPDLLAGVPHFSPHDIRRTFATVCGNATVRGDAISSVLDHAGLETGQQMMRSAEVTRLAYDYSQKLELKRIAMEAWTNRLFEAVETVWKENRPRLRQPTPPWKSGRVPFSPNAPWYALMRGRKEREVAEAEKTKADAAAKRLPMSETFPKLAAIHDDPEGEVAE